MIRSFCLFILSSCLLFGYGFSSETIIVSSVEREPFVYEEYGEIKGFSVDLWKKIARKMNVSYTFEMTDSFSEMLDNVSNKKSDLAIANISITSQREKIMDFSHPIFDSGLQMISAYNSNQSSFIGSILQSPLIQIIAGIFLLVFIAHKAGIVMGKVLTMCWFVVCGVIIINVTNAYGSNEIGVDTKISELTNKKIGAAKNTTMSAYLNDKGIKYLAYDDFNDSLEALLAGEVDVIVGDAAVVRYYAKNEGKRKVKLIGDIFAPDKLAIALPNNSRKEKEEINQALLSLIEDGTYELLIDKYFGDDKS